MKRVFAAGMIMVSLGCIMMWQNVMTGLALDSILFFFKNYFVNLGKEDFLSIVVLLCVWIFYEFRSRKQAKQN
ncbi:hypothetical protein [Peribacillus deserti]|uniref:Lipoprotein n=1 Tax=Peribacillus deserti TaxID=673318 RepID=A0A2N5M8N4_9BACI|nr:hypothetical protein [Peribacillus deserti]PLT30705.1 hypothetical protein CUU66_05995 [Peribacillus deserti]